MGADRVAPPLAVHRRGAGGRLGLVHGFTQTARSWDVLAERWARSFEIVAVDAPGHGGSADVRADLPAGASLLGDAVGRAAYVGYSMGGRLALHLAVARPDLVEALVLLGATPGIRDAGERAARRRSDELLAEAVERDGVEAFVTDWLAGPLFATLAPDAAGIDDRLRNSVAGLASSLRLAGTGTQEPLWDRLAGLPMPVLLVAGADDGRFAAIAAEMAAVIPRGEVVIVERAGHAAHLERPDAFADLVETWLGG